ncbi:hypothetical protein KAI30_03680 [Candidatus Bathyarchaeota archaeon]|nr:hypothetical protein [Candidatus Bathyarchaeota archaeon]
MRARRIYNEMVAKTVKGTRALIEAGFEKVDEFNGLYIYRKRKYTKLRKDKLNAENRV